MNKKYIASLLGIVAVVVVVFAGTSVKATGSFWENVETKVANILSGKVPAPIVSVAQVVLGATQTIAANITNPTDVDALTNMENLFNWGIHEVAGDLFADSNLILGSASSTSAGVSNTGQFQVVSSNYFADATTTPFCVASPFAATSTVELVGIKYTSIATTSVSFIIATSTQSTGLTTSTQNFGVSAANQLLNINLLSSAVATNTVFMNGDFTDVRSAQNTATAQKLVVIPSEYVCGVIGEGNGGRTTGVTNPVNLFGGTYGLRWTRLGS